MEMIRTVSTQKPLGLLQQKSPSEINGGEDATSEELLLAASELREATEMFFEVIADPTIAQAEFKEQSSELLAAYDELLAIFEDVLKSLNESRVEDQATVRLVRDNVIRLQATFDHDRDLLAGVFAVIEREIVGNE